MRKIINCIKHNVSVFVKNYKSKFEYNISARVEKHYCPNCQELLQVIKKSQIVHSDSGEAQNFDFSSRSPEGGMMTGNVKFIWDIYYCVKCNSEMNIRDVRKHDTIPQ